MKKKLQFTAVLLMLVIITGTASWQSHQNRKPIIYAESLDTVILTVDERPLTLKDFAFYVAYEEMNVQKQAVVYDPEHPKKYWNLYINDDTESTFIRKAARQAILDMAVHDDIFYQIACEEGLELDKEEEAYLENEIYDFFSDLEEGQIEALGVEREDLEASMQKIAIANKYQSILSEMEGVDYASYDFDGDAYQKLLAEHEYTAVESIVKRISIGSITLNNQ